MLTRDACRLWEQGGLFSCLFCTSNFSILKMHNHGNESIIWNTVSLRHCPRVIPRDTMVEQKLMFLKNWRSLLQEALVGLTWGWCGEKVYPCQGCHRGAGSMKRREHRVLPAQLQPWPCLKGHWGCEAPGHKGRGSPTVNVPQQQRAAKDCVPHGKYSLLQRSSVLPPGFYLVAFSYSDMHFCWTICFFHFWNFLPKPGGKMHSPVGRANSRKGGPALDQTGSEGLTTLNSLGGGSLSTQHRVVSGRRSEANTCENSLPAHLSWVW